MNIIKNNIEMHFDKFNLRSFWSHLINQTSGYRLLKIYNTIIRKAVCLNCTAEKWFKIFQGQEAQKRSVICHLNIIWQFAGIGNNVTDGSSILNVCYIFGVFAILRDKFTSNEN